MRLPDREMICLFNWDDTVQKVSFRPARTSAVADFWSGEKLGKKDKYTIDAMPPHAARLFVCR
jgi:hypothetical protein